MSVRVVLSPDSVNDEEDNLKKEEHEQLDDSVVSQIQYGVDRQEDFSSNCCRQIAIPFINNI